MVNFPLSTELLVFDLEAYVPAEDRRKKTGASLAVNPFREGHTLLGGVFHLSRPRTREILTEPAFEHHWIWDEGDEAEVVSSIYQIFSGMRRRASVKKQHHADPVVAGVGIAQFDMPCIFAKCLAHEVAPADEIYETVCKVRVVDLAVAGIGFLPSKAPVLYPKTHNALADRFIPERAKKPTGKVVWEMADEKDFAGIAERCAGEVKEMVLLTERMIAETKVKE
ncbi:MAG: hypothetical protein E7Z72_01455 [Methanocorpusculum parvum]|nr:hypothetical protein [Methanocorpusculum parvum]